MSSNNIYSQLTYFLVDIVTNEANPNTESSEIMEILGLLSDSFYGMASMGHIKIKKDK